MPAIRRRTRFAAPLVITLAAGCGKAEQHGGVNPPEPGSASAIEHTHNPPAPTPLAATWQVTRANSGECWAEQDVKCEPDESCNPPPPRKIECPAGIAKTPVTITRLADFACAVVPAGCDAQDCAHPKTPCPMK